MSTKAFGAAIARLKAAVGAESDSDLARALDLSRYAVAKWRAKGSIPPAYSFLVDGGGADTVDSAILFNIRRNLYRHPHNRYFLRASLKVLQLVNRDPTDDPAEGEVILTRLMGMASDTCLKVLGQAYCETEEDYSALLSAILSPSEEERLLRTLATIGYEPTPQSDSAISA